MAPKTISQKCPTQSKFELVKLSYRPRIRCRSWSTRHWSVSYEVKVNYFFFGRSTSSESCNHLIEWILDEVDIVSTVKILSSDNVSLSLNNVMLSSESVIFFMAGTFWSQDFLAPGHFGAWTFWHHDFSAPWLFCIMTFVHHDFWTPWLLGTMTFGHHDFWTP